MSQLVLKGLHTRMGQAVGVATPSEGVVPAQSDWLLPPFLRAVPRPLVPLKRLAASNRPALVESESVVDYPVAGRLFPKQRIVGQQDCIAHSTVPISAPVSQLMGHRTAGAG